MEIRAKCKFDFESIGALTHLSLFKKANPKKRFLTWSIISGFDFVPHDENYFADLCLHPNDKGFGHYFQSLVKKLL